MMSKVKKGIGLFWIMLSYQLLFLFLIMIAVNGGMYFILDKEFTAITVEELEKRNQLLQLTLEEKFIPDRSGLPLNPAVLPPQHEGLPRPPELAAPDEDMITEILHKRIHDTSRMTETRYTVLTATGEVQFDSLISFPVMDNIKSKPEIAALLEDKERTSSYSVREEELTGEKTIYQALPLYSDGKLIGITRVSQPYRLTEELHMRIIADIRLSFYPALIIITIILLFVIRQNTRLVGNLEKTALAIANGNFDHPLPRAISREFANLIDSMDHMAVKLKSQIQTIEEQNRELKEQSLIDELTGLGNRRYFNQKLDYAWWLCLRGNHPISFLILDIDKFKQYNDALGHPAGDECLKRVSAVLKQSMNRHTDVLARLGGEEFGVLLPEGDRRQAESLGNIIMENINGAALPHPDSPVAPHVTLSIGTVTLHPTGEENSDELMDLADKALYRAKEEGRNRMETWKP